MSRRASTPIVFPELDTLRALAITLVLATHAEGWIARGTPDAAGALPLGRAVFRAGHTGVSLFFVLSAFLLARPFWTEVLGGARVDVPAYARRRFWRIVPLYACAVVAATIATSTTLADVGRALPYLLFVPQDFLPETQRFPPTFSAAWWSLSTEIQFYFLLPFLALAHRSRAGRWLGGLVLATVTGGYVVLVSGGWPGITWATLFTCAHTVIGRAPLFAWGIAAAFVSVRFAASLRAGFAWPTWLRAGGADVLLLVFVATTFGALAWVESTMQYATLEAFHPTWHVAEGAAWAAVVLAGLYAPLRWRRQLTARPLVWIGQISYSIYLLHMPVLGYGLWGLRLATGVNLRGWSVASALAIVGLIGLTLALSSLTYRWIELPMIRFGRRGDGSARPALGVAVPAHAEVDVALQAERERPVPS